MDTRVNLPKIEKHVSVEDLLFGLMKVDSTSGNEGNVGQVLSNWLQLHGWHVKQQTDPKNQHRFNVLATRKPLDEMYGKIAVVLNSHIDTVPPYIPPDLNTDGTIIKGRGSCDAKGQVVAMCHAANRLDEKLKEKVALLFVYSEETDHQGAKDCNALNLNPTTAIIVGEPTERKLATSQKGIVKINLTSVGKAAHSGYPEKGIDALGPMLDVLQDLRNFEWPVDEKLGKTTMNIGVLHSGRASNIIPDRAECQILFRVVTNTQEIMDSIHKVCSH